MTAPTYPSEGGGSKVDAYTNSAGTTAMKRGYGTETPAGSTVTTLHAGVAEIPAAIFSAASTATPAVVTASLPVTSSGTNYLDGFAISGTGANATSVVQATIAGLQTTNMGIYLSVPSGANTAMTPLITHFAHPIPASAASTAITISVPSFGTGNVGVSVAIWGHKSL